MTRAALVLAVLAVLLACQPAQAYWRTSGSGAGSGGASTLSVPVVTVPASASGAVPVSWTAAALSPPNATYAAQTSYAVQRSADGGVTWSPAAGTCAGSLAAATTSCSDTPPTSGSYVYSVSASLHTWTAIGASGTVAANMLTAPTISAKPSSPSANAAPSFSFTGGGGSGFQCQLDGGAWAACTSPKALSALANGSHTFAVRATQASFTGPSTTSTWTVNTSAPTISAAPPSTSASTSASFTFSDGSYASFQCQLDGAGFTACTSPKAYSALAVGSHTFQVRAVDADGVTTAIASSTWTIATAAPTLTSQPANPTTQASATFAFSETGFSAFACKLDTGSFAACNSGTVTYSGLLAGSHTFTVHALDGAGVATSDRTYTWTINAVATVAMSSCKSSKVQGTTTVKTGTLTVRIYAGSGTGGTLAATLATTSFTGSTSPFGWSVTPSGLTTGATYTAQASQVDGSGNASTAPTCTFTA
jgi:hypothetical protein